MLRDWQMRLGALRNDHRSSPQEIVDRALELLIDAVVDSDADGVLTYRRWLIRTGRDVNSAQPSLGGLFRLVNDMLWASHDALSAEEMRQQALAFLQDYRPLAEAALELLARRAAELLAPRRTILTYSRSATLLRALTTLAGDHRPPRVLCSEARPMLEGQTLASELGWAGIDVTIGVDMALFGWLEEADACVVGADSISVAGCVGKIGTAALARAAMARDVPFFVLCAESKFLPEDYIVEGHLASGASDEIMPTSDAHLTVRNIYHDVTPLDLLTTVVTERGPLDADDLLAALQVVRTYPGLRSGT